MDNLEENKIDINECPIVRVTWQDAYDMPCGWVEPSEILEWATATCTDVGWLVYRDEQKVTLMGSWNGDQGGRVTTIPADWVQTIDYLEAEVTIIN
mgnify:FL=1